MRKLAIESARAVGGAGVVYLVMACGAGDIVDHSAPVTPGAPGATQVPDAMAQDSDDSDRDQVGSESVTAHRVDAPCDNGAVAYRLDVDRDALVGATLEDAASFRPAILGADGTPTLGCSGDTVTIRWFTLGSAAPR